MNDFTKDFAQALFNPDKINDLLRKELQQAVNNLLEAELTAFLGYDPYARDGWNTGNSHQHPSRTHPRRNHNHLGALINKRTT